LDSKNLYGSDKIMNTRIKNRVDLNLYKKDSDDSDSDEDEYHTSTKEY